MSLLETSSSSDCPIYHLPGRDWFYLPGPQTRSARNLVFGLVEFAAGALAGAYDPTTPAVRP